MAIIDALSSGTPSLQSTLVQTRVARARREADQAQRQADTLRQQADEQERVARQARNRAQTLQYDARTAKPILEMNLATTRKNSIQFRLFEATTARAGRLLDTSV